MCGRFSLAASNITELAGRFQAQSLPFELKPRYNLAPSQETLAVVNWQDRRQLVPMKWGLPPYWSKKGQKPIPLINVRSESLIGKPIFKPYFERQRCLIPADGFFEWRQEGKHKIPYRAVVKDEPLFAFAGLWEQVLQPDGTFLYSFALLTTESNSLIYTIHDRMPVILTKEGENAWLDPAIPSVKEIALLLQPYPADEMILYRVSSEVNAVKNDSPNCIAPA